MKIMDTDSILFVKQDLFNRISPNKASKANGKELDSILSNNINQNQRDVFGDSYNIEFSNNFFKSRNTEKGIITFNGDYDWWSVTPEDSLYNIERHILSSLSRVSAENRVCYTDCMKDFARSLNSYARFEGDDGNLENDPYLQSITERLDILDPEHNDSRLTQMREMVNTIQSGSKIIVEGDKLYNQLQQSAIDISNVSTFSTSKLTLENNTSNAGLIEKKIQAYQLSMAQVQNNSDMIAKLLGKSTSTNITTSVADILNFKHNDDKSSLIEMRNKKLDLELDNSSNKISTDTSIPPDDSDIKVTITATDWHEVSKKYAYEHKNDIPLLNFIHDY